MIHKKIDFKKKVQKFYTRCLCPPPPKFEKNFGHLGGLRQRVLR